jgi:hypothetical protein
LVRCVRIPADSDFPLEVSAAIPCAAIDVEDDLTIPTFALAHHPAGIAAAIVSENIFHGCLISATIDRFVEIDHVADLDAELEIAHCGAPVLL